MRQHMRHLLIVLGSIPFLCSVSCSLFTPKADNKASREVKSVTSVAGAENPVPSSLKGDVEDSLNASLKKRILVLNFTNKTQYGGKELGEHAANEVRDAISKLREYVIVPEEEVEGYEAFSTQTGRYNLKTIFEKARAHGVVAIVSGSIEDLDIRERGDEVGLFQTRYHTVTTQLKFQLFDAANEKTLLSKLQSAEVTEEHMRFLGSRGVDSYDASRGEGAISKALEKILPSFSAQAKKIAWVGRIAKIDLHRFYLNAGESSGLSRGQLLRVFGPSQAVLDEDGKSLLGMAQGRFKGILKVVDYFGNDGAVAIVHSGAGFKEKDRVEIYSPPPSN